MRRTPIQEDVKLSAWEACLCTLALHRAGKGAGHACDVMLAQAATGSHVPGSHTDHIGRVGPGECTRCGGDGLLGSCSARGHQALPVAAVGAFDWQVRGVRGANTPSGLTPGSLQVPRQNNKPTTHKHPLPTLYSTSTTVHSDLRLQGSHILYVHTPPRQPALVRLVLQRHPCHGFYASICLCCGELYGFVRKGSLKCRPTALFLRIEGVVLAYNFAPPTFDAPHLLPTLVSSPPLSTMLVCLQIPWVYSSAAPPEAQRLGALWPAFQPRTVSLSTTPTPPTPSLLADTVSHGCISQRCQPPA